METYLKSAETAALAITPEIHRAYTNDYASSTEFHDFVVELYGGTWGQEYVKKYSYYPILNAGVLAMPKLLADLEAVGRQHPGVAGEEPPPLHRAGGAQPRRLRASRALPLRPARQEEHPVPARHLQLAVPSEPAALRQGNEAVRRAFLPHQPLGVIHRSSDDFKDKKSAPIYTTDGDTVVCNLKYKEGVYDTTVKSVEPEKLSDWQGRGGKKY